MDAPTTVPTSGRRTLYTAVLFGLYCIPAAIGLRPIIDVDIWWHLREGAWILQNKAIPLTDPFTSYGMGKTWIAYSWLYEILVHALYTQFGLFGLVVYTTALAFCITLALHHLLQRQANSFVYASGLTALAVASMFPVLVHPRPWLFNVLFVIIELAVLLEVRRSRRTRWLFALPPLFLVWACINIQFVYGLFILGLAAAEPMIHRIIGVAAPQQTLRARALLVTLVACAVGTCLTPYHVNIYIPVITAVRLTDPFLFLTELQAPSFRHPFDWAALGLVLAAVFTLGRQRSIPLFHLLLLTTAVFVAFRARRDVWLLVIASVAILAMVRVPSFARCAALGKVRVMAVATSVLAVTVWLGMTRASPAQLDRVLSDEFPVGAVAFVERHGYQGRVYNHYDWGGYLVWRLPALDVTLDGRNPLHGDTRIWQSIRTWGGHPDWASDPELASAALVIADTDTALSSLLRYDSRFALVYEDRVAAVFERR
jgi:hypothetical protein